MTLQFAPVKTLRIAHLTMVLCFVVVSLAATAVYGFDEKFSIGTKVAFHISIIILPVFFKLGYILRLYSLKQLDLPVN